MLLSKKEVEGSAADPVVILGAPRSGTNLLRDVLTRCSVVATWPCDEINAVWRNHNSDYPSDELPAALAGPRTCRYIRRQFDWVARRYRADIVVEKTCANSLRVPFVDAVLPEARYIFIRRDGVDAAGSAMKRWTASGDFRYLARKARFVPVSDLPYYVARFVGNRFHRLVSRERRAAIWGPRIEGIADLLATRPLDEVCALQWQRCVELTADALADIGRERWIEIAYEDFVRDPVPELERIVRFLELDVAPDELERMCGSVRPDSIGRGRAEFDPDASRRIEMLIGDTLGRFGYA